MVTALIIFAGWLFFVGFLILIVHSAEICRHREERLVAEAERQYRHAIIQRYLQEQ